MSYRANTGYLLTDFSQQDELRIHVHLIYIILW